MAQQNERCEGLSANCLISIVTLTREGISSPRTRLCGWPPCQSESFVRSIQIVGIFHLLALHRKPKWGGRCISGGFYSNFSTNWTIKRPVGLGRLDSKDNGKCLFERHQRTNQAAVRIVGWIAWNWKVGWFSPSVRRFDEFGSKTSSTIPFGFQPFGYWGVQLWRNQRTAGNFRVNCTVKLAPCPTLVTRKTGKKWILTRTS